MTKSHLDRRLSAAASFVRQGAFFADIGTDHAYLPLFLLSQGTISRAVAADINEGPLQRAHAHARECGFAAQIDFRLTDGLQGMDDLGLTDIAICGMGGELIARIIESAPFVKNAAIRLILQPMSRAAHLRRYLAANGFAVEEEKICSAAGRHYACLCVAYTGIPYLITDAEAECGRALLSRRPDEGERAYVRGIRQTAVRRIDGLCAADSLSSDRLSELDKNRKLLLSIDAYLAN